MKSDTIEELVAGCRNGDRRCQRIVYEMFYRRMLGACLRYCDNTEEAKDVLQEGFLKVFKNIGKYDFKGSFEGWIRKIVVNTTIDNFRKNKHVYYKIDYEQDIDNFKSLVDDDDDDSFREFAGINTEDIVKAVQRLSPAYRTVFNLYIVEGLTHKEISDELGISIGTSKSNLGKAKNNLRRLLKK